MRISNALAALMVGLVLTGTAAAQSDEKATDLFKTLDANNDGKLTAG